MSPARPTIPPARLLDIGPVASSRARPALQLRRLGVGIGLAVLYVLAAKLGLAFAFLHPSASPVWPPTGLALAALLILGLRAWPAIFAGAFVANLLTAGSLRTSLGIALGNTLEALLGARLVTRFAVGAAAFGRAPDPFKFFTLGGLLSPVVSATLGVTSLGLGGFTSAEVDRLLTLVQRAQRDHRAGLHPPAGGAVFGSCVTTADGYLLQRRHQLWS